MVSCRLKDDRTIDNIIELKTVFGTVEQLSLGVTLLTNKITKINIKISPL